MNHLAGAVGPGLVCIHMMRKYSGRTVPVLARFAEVMQCELDAKGFGLFIASSCHTFARERDLLRNFAQRRVDGLVIATSSERSPHLLRLLSGCSS